MKKELMKELLELTKEQSVALQEEDIDTFHLLIQKRQVIIDRVAALEREHPELGIEKDEVLLKELIVLNTQNATEYKKQFEEVKRKLEDTRRQMSQMRQRQHVSNIYSNPYDLSQEEGIFFDKK